MNHLDELTAQHMAEQKLKVKKPKKGLFSSITHRLQAYMLIAFTWLFAAFVAVIYDAREDAREFVAKKKSRRDY